MPVWLGGAVRAQKECVQKKPEADCASSLYCTKGEMGVVDGADSFPA